MSPPVGEIKQRGSVDAKKYRATDLTIIGVDTDDGPDVLGYDEQCTKMSEDDWQRMIRSILDVGEVIQPIVGRRDGLRIIVVAGRKRVIAVRRINKENGWEGTDKEIVVPTTMGRRTDEEFLAVQIAENEGRIQRTPLQRARLAERAHRRNWSDERICETFHVKLATLRQWRKGLELDDKVLALVERGEIKLHAAVQLGEFPRAEQHKRALAMIESGATTVAAGAAQRTQGRTESANDDDEGGKRKGKGASRGARTPGAYRPPSKPTLTKLYNESGRGSALKCSVASILEWALGLAGPPPEIAKLLATKEPGGKRGQKPVKGFVQQALPLSGK